MSKLSPKTLTVLLLTIITIHCFANTEHAIKLNNTNTLTNPTGCGPAPVAQCDENCIIHIKSVIDQFRADNAVPAVQLTFSFHDPKNPKNFTYQTYCSGTTTRDGTTPIDKNSLFEIASITKSFTAAIVLKLAAAGKLNLNDTIGKWLPEDNYAAWNNITIDQLLHHTSGIFANETSFGYHYIAAIKEDLAQYRSAKELTDWAYLDGPTCKVYGQYDSYCPHNQGRGGVGYSYSDTNYILLERIVEKATNTTLEKLMYTELFSPLELKNTIYTVTTNPADIKNIVHGYYGLITPPVLLKPAQDTTNYSMSYERGAGAIITTSEDLAHWVRAIFSQNLLPPVMSSLSSLVCIREDMVPGCVPGKPLPSGSPEAGYGYGLEKGTTNVLYGSYWSHSGSNLGYQSIFAYTPKNDFVVTAFLDVANLIAIENLSYAVLPGIYRYLFH